MGGEWYTNHHPQMPMNIELCPPPPPLPPLPPPRSPGHVSVCEFGRCGCVHVWDAALGSFNTGSRHIVQHQQLAAPERVDAADDSGLPIDSADDGLLDRSLWIKSGRSVIPTQWLWFTSFSYPVHISFLPTRVSDYLQAPESSAPFTSLGHFSSLLA